MFANSLYRFTNLENIMAIYIGQHRCNSMSKNTQLLAKLSKRSVIARIQDGTSRDKNRIVNPWLLDQITTAAPSLTLKSSSVTKALELFAIHVITQHPPLSQGKKLLKVLNVLIPVLYGDSGGAAIQATYQRIRKVIAKEMPTLVDAGYSAMQYDQVKWRAERKEYENKVVQANKTQRPVTDINDIDDAIETGLKEGDWKYGCVAAELASGARISEILSISTFKATPGKAKMITQSDLAKKREGDDSVVIKPIIGMTVSRFIRLIKQIRTSLPTSTSEMEGYELSQRLNKSINLVVSKLLPSVKGTHTLRKLYAARAWKLYGATVRTASRWRPVTQHKPS